jgi:ADP-heptose:LPS heptosyltransferase
MSAWPGSILAVQFKYLGDAVFLTPALRALRESQPAGELHVLVAEEVAPLLKNLAWINRVWALPRTRGRARLRESWPLILALRRERFQRAVDFGGNDRGAIMSFLSGARTRLGPVDGKPRLLKRWCYSETFPTAELPDSWVQRHLKLLSAWQIPPPKSLALEISPDPAWSAAAARLLPAGRILCHLATSQPKKEWPLRHWLEFNRQATAAGWALAFSSGTSERERILLAQLKTLEPALLTLPPVAELGLFLSVLKRARAVIAGDTGPLHFAAGLGVPVLGLLATGDSLRRIQPIYPPAQILAAPACACDQRLKNFSVCQAANPCMATIPPDQVLTALQALLGAPENR